jgi:hypothetical protein
VKAGVFFMGRAELLLRQPLEAARQVGIADMKSGVSRVLLVR